MPLGTDVGLSPWDFVLDGDPLPSPKRGRSPPIFAHVYCGQTAGRIKMALGMEIGLGPVHIVLDGDTAPLPKRGPNGWMHQCATWYGGMVVGLSLGDCVRWGPSQVRMRASSQGTLC